jgi:hypothetical protein
VRRGVGSARRVWGKRAARVWARAVEAMALRNTRTAVSTGSASSCCSSSSAVLTGAVTAGPTAVSTPASASASASSGWAAAAQSART